MPRVLIVDDAPALRKLLRAALELEGYEVYEAADGAEGLEKAEPLCPDLIFLDVQMPGLDRYAVCAAPFRLPVLAALAKTVLDAAQRGAGEQAQGRSAGGGSPRREGAVGDGLGMGLYSCFAPSLVGDRCKRPRTTREGTMDEATKPNLPRLISLFIAFIGCVVTALPFTITVGADPVPFILWGSGVAVVALALFLFFSL